MKFNLVERELALQIIWSFCDLYKKSIDCYNGVIKEFNKIDNKCCGTCLETLPYRIACIKECIRDMRTLIRKRDFMNEIIFKKEKIEQLNYLISDFLNVQKTFTQKHTYNDAEIKKIINILTTSY